MPILTFEVSYDKYAIYSKFIQKIIPYKESTKVPGSEPFIEGVVYYREKPIVVIDTKAMLHYVLCDRKSENIVVVNINGNLFGLTCDKVIEIVTDDDYSIEPLSRIFSKEKTMVIDEIARIEENLYNILSIEKIYKMNVDD